MIEQNTLLILGAGASAPYGFETARELRDKAVNGSIRVPASDFFGQEGDWMDAAVQRLCENLGQTGWDSIDRFLEFQSDRDIETGKKIIAAGLIHGESDSQLFRCPAKDDWYGYLFREMSATSLKDFANNKLAIVTFNYDRSIEHFLTCSLANTFRVHVNDAWKTVSQIRIEHLYGMLGLYAPSENVVEHSSRMYGVRHQVREVNLSARQISIVRNSESSDLLLREDLVDWADRVIVLGFGFDPTNVARLGLGRLPRSKSLIATRVGLTDRECEEAERLVGRHIRFGSPTSGNLQFIREEVSLGEKAMA